MENDFLESRGKRLSVFGSQPEMPGMYVYLSVEVEDDGAADSDDGSTGGGRRDRNSSAKKTVAPLKIKINKKKKKRRGSDVRPITL